MPRHESPRLQRSAEESSFGHVHSHPMRGGAGPGPSLGTMRTNPTALPPELGTRPLSVGHTLHSLYLKSFVPEAPFPVFALYLFLSSPFVLDRKFNYYGILKLS